MGGCGAVLCDVDEYYHEVVGGGNEWGGRHASFSGGFSRFLFFGWDVMGERGGVVGTHGDGFKMNCLR